MEITSTRSLPPVDTMEDKDIKAANDAKKAEEKKRKKAEELLQGINQLISGLIHTIANIDKLSNSENRLPSSPSPAFDPTISRIDQWLAQAGQQGGLPGLSSVDILQLRRAVPDLVKDYAKIKQGTQGPTPFIGNYSAAQVMEELLPHTIQLIKQQHPGAVIDVAKIGKQLCEALANQPAGTSAEQIMRNIARDYSA